MVSSKPGLELMIRNRQHGVALATKPALTHGL